MQIPMSLKVLRWEQWCGVHIKLLELRTLSCVCREGALPSVVAGRCERSPKQGGVDEVDWAKTTKGRGERDNIHRGDDESI